MEIKDEIFDLIKDGVKKHNQYSEKEMSQILDRNITIIRYWIKKLSNENKIKRFGNRAIKIIGE